MSEGKIGQRWCTSYDLQSWGGS